MRRALAGGLLALAAFLATVPLAPARATAASVYSPTGAVQPVLECVGRAGDGSWRAVLGYTNSAGAKTIPLGAWNSISPTQYNGSQPTSYKAGTQHGVLSLTLSAYDYTYGGTTWMLDGNMVFIGATFASGVPTCTPLQMPAEGNDTGAAIALVAAGLLGVLVLVRLRRRLVSGALAGAAGREHGDA